MSGKDKIRVALLWKTYGGNGTSVNDLVAGLDPSRFEVLFVHLGQPPAAGTWPEEVGQRVFFVPRGADGRMPAPSAILKLARIFKDQQVDVLHCHNHKAAVCGTLAALLARTPVLLVQIHGLNRTRNLRRKLENVLVLRRADKILVVADAVKDDIIRNNWRVPRRKFVVLENSVDYERFATVATTPVEAKQMLGVGPDAFVFGAVGRLAPTKGLAYLIEAFGAVRQQVPAAQLVLLGEGQSRAELEEQARRSGCQAAVHFLGQCDHMPQLLRGLDVLVLPSVAEGMPRVILEAMAAGVPVIAARVGGIPEVINEPGVGFLVPPRDATALGQMMVHAARLSTPQRGAIAAAAQERVLRFYSHAVMRERLRQLYEEEHAYSCARGNPAARKDLRACKRVARAGR